MSNDEELKALAAQGYASWHDMAHKLEAVALKMSGKERDYAIIGFLRLAASIGRRSALESGVRCIAKPPRNENDYPLVRFGPTTRYEGDGFKPARLVIEGGE